MHGHTLILKPMVFTIILAMIFPITLPMILPTLPMPPSPSHGSWFSYTSTPRARIFARDQGKVEDEHSMIKLMRS